MCLVKIVSSKEVQKFSGKITHNLRSVTTILLLVSAILYPPLSFSTPQAAKTKIFLVKGHIKNSATFEDAVQAFRKEHPKYAGSVDIEIYNYDGESVQENGVNTQGSGGNFITDLKKIEPSKRIIVGFSRGVAKIKEAVEQHGIFAKHVTTLDGYNPATISGISIDFISGYDDRGWTSYVVYNYRQKRTPFLQGAPHIVDPNRYDDRVLNHNREYPVLAIDLGHTQIDGYWVGQERLLALVRLYDPATYVNKAATSSASESGIESDTLEVNSITYRKLSNARYFRR